MQRTQRTIVTNRTIVNELKESVANASLTGNSKNKDLGVRELTLDAVLYDLDTDVFWQQADLLASPIDHQLHFASAASSSSIAIGDTASGPYAPLQVTQ